MRRTRRHPLRPLALFTAMLAACGGSTHARAGATQRRGSEMSQGSSAVEAREAIEALLRRYEAALNASDGTAAVGVYGEDAVFMAQHRAPAMGTAAIRRAYDEIFEAIRLNVAFGVDEVEVAGDTAWARTHSSGETEIRATGARVPERNSELFIFQRRPDGAWRVARYLFATQNPPR